MPLRIQDLQAGDQLQIWMLNGLAIRPKRTSKGVQYYEVPSRARSARNGEHAKFQGLVVQNRPEDAVITVTVSLFNSLGHYVSDGIPKQVDLPYSALMRVRKVSAIAYEPLPDFVGDRGTRITRRPGSVGLGTNRKPYRTVTEVLIR